MGGIIPKPKAPKPIPRPEPIVEEDPPVLGMKDTDTKKKKSSGLNAFRIDIGGSSGGGSGINIPL